MATPLRGAQSGSVVRSEGDVGEGDVDSAGGDRVGVADRGWIGIMNIMLAPVTERTKEIGVAAGGGPTTKEILSRFLMEAVMLPVLGGLWDSDRRHGVVLISRFAEWNTQISPGRWRWVRVSGHRGSVWGYLFGAKGGVFGPDRGVAV